MKIIALLFITFLLLAVIVLVAVVFFLEIFGWSRTRVPFVPMPKKLREALPRILNLTAASRFYDLGSGDGRVVFALAKTTPGAVCTGVEIAPLPYLLSYIRSLVSDTPNAKTLLKNFFDVPLTDATHVFMYLLPGPVEKLLPKFEEELKPGTRVVSCDFPFTKRAAQQKFSIEGHVLYVYEF